MPLNPGESVSVKGNSSKPYIIKNIDGVISCSCPSWRNMGGPIDARVCKHIRNILGTEAAKAYLGSAELPEQVKVKETKKVPALMLAEVWTKDMDPKGYLMSEKLDGVRAYWDGENFISRLGNIYYAPDWFKQGLPKGIPLDGELWMKRKAFQETVSIVRRQDAGDLWKQITYMVFDAPALIGKLKARLFGINPIFSEKLTPYAKLLPQTECAGIEHLEKELKVIEKLGGEGVMLHNPDMAYTAGRSRDLLKVKNFKDGEATVIRHEKGKGRHSKRVGALVCLSELGIEFSLGTGLSDKERENPPAIGSTVVYRYQELSRDKVPRFPSFVGTRAD